MLSDGYDRGKMYDGRGKMFTSFKISKKIDNDLVLC